MNIVARSDVLYAEAIAAIGAVFPVVLEMAVEEDINRIAVAMVSRRTGLSSAGLVKSTVELHKACGSAWGGKNPNAVWTEEVTSSAKEALSSAKVVSSDGKAAPKPRGAPQQPQNQKKAGGKKSKKKKR